MQSDFFGGLGPRVSDNSLFKLRRKELVDGIKKELNPAQGSVVVLFGAIEAGHERFRQDKTFFYYTGINEPGSVLVLDMNGKSALYLANCLLKRAQWMTLSESLVKMDAKALGFDTVELLGDECEGYTLNPYFSSDDYKHMLALLNSTIVSGATIFTLAPDNGYEYAATRYILDHLGRFIPEMSKAVVDVSSFVAISRRRKDISEIEKIYRAIEITELAHESAIQAIKSGVLESEVQASLEYIMTASHARPSFPSIVASGKNSTVLHHCENKGTLQDGDVVIVDIGAELDNYCADLTRTYPVSGTFTKRQKELYNIVLDTQEYIAGLAKPGMWLKNKEKADKSLHHLAQKFLEKNGYAQYFPHGIGHFLGLDVHDVGDYNEPLHEGDVITIEPGIYIPQEGIGIRIEDNYWVTKDGVMCLSENLPKDAQDIEEFMQQIAKEDAEEESSDQEEDYEDYEDDEDDFN